MADPIRIGIIGANPERGWALQSHLPGLVVLPEFEVTAVATTREESAKATAEIFGVRLAFADANELITSDEVDLVSVSVKVPHHYHYVKAAIASGKHVYCEWPLGANTEEAMELAALAKAAGVRNVVGLQGRKSPVANYVRDLVADGYVGRVLSASLSVAMAGRGGVTVPEERVWAADKNNGATTLSIIGGHNIDVLRYCLGGPKELDALVAVRYPEATVVETGAPVTVTSPDVVLVHGELERGGYVSISVQGGLPKGAGVLFEIQGTDGVLQVSGPGSLHLSDNALTLRGATGDASLVELDVPDTYKTVPDDVPAGSARNIAGLYQAVANAIDHGVPVDPDFDTAVSLHRLLDTIDQASTTGSRQAPTP
jgi:predicted dehydrogenase